MAELPNDVNGIVDGPEYPAFLKPRDMHSYKSLRSGIEGVWSGRTHFLASLDEHSVFFELEANPYVLSIREGYPLATPDLTEDLLKGMLVDRNRVMTIDFVLTLPPKNFGGALRYHGVYRKPALLSSTLAGERRIAKERRVLEEIGWTWSSVKVPSSTRVASLWKLREWAKAGPIDRAARDAAELATLLYRTTSTKDLDPLLRMLGKRLGIAPSDQYFVFAAAFYFGYVSVAKDEVLDEGCPLLLSPPIRKPCGVFIHG